MYWQTIMVNTILLCHFISIETLFYAIYYIKYINLYVMSKKLKVR